MVIAEAVAIVGGLKAATSACKTAINTAKDISEIATHLNTIFNHKEAAEKRLKAIPQKKSKKLLSFFSRKTGEDEEDDTSIASAMNAVVQQKILDREILNLSIKINNKFGAGTWQAIVKEREKRVNAKRERDRKSKELANKKAKASSAMWRKIVVESGKVIILILVVGVFYLYLSWAYNK